MAKPSKNTINVGDRVELVKRVECALRCHSPFRVVRQGLKGIVFEAQKDIDHLTVDWETPSHRSTVPSNQLIKI